MEVLRGGVGSKGGGGTLWEEVGTEVWGHRAVGHGDMGHRDSGMMGPRGGAKGHEGTGMGMWWHVGCGDTEWGHGVGTRGYGDMGCIDGDMGRRGTVTVRVLGLQGRGDGDSRGWGRGDVEPWGNGDGDTEGCGARDVGWWWHGDIGTREGGSVGHCGVGT